jgi:hypothetical protein
MNYDTDNEIDRMVRGLSWLGLEQYFIHLTGSENPSRADCILANRKEVSEWSMAMKIETIERHGICATINLAPNDRNWGSMAGKFYFQSDDLGESFNLGYHDTLAGAQEAFKNAVDKWWQTIPHTEEEWYAAISACMVWTGYESCHISKPQALRVLEMASKHYGRE